MSLVTVQAARDAARDWVLADGRRYPGYVGAYVSGSTAGMAPGAVLPLGSDVDIMLVTQEPARGLKLGKFVHWGVLLEVTYLPWVRIAPAETALADYHVAAGLWRDGIIDDPSGALRTLQQAVARDFADAAWVRRRCAAVERRIRDGFAGIDAAAPWHEQVTSWLFATGVTTHLLLVAGLRNPTVRLRYLRTRELLAECGLDDIYPELLRQLGSDEISPERVEQHVRALARSFDAAAAVGKTPFFFSSDITAAARPIAIDASLELIRQGDHREAMFWIAATFARCRAVMARDAPAALRDELAGDFEAVVGDLGIGSTSDLLARAEATKQFLPVLWQTAERLMASGAARQS